MVNIGIEQNKRMAQKLMGNPTIDRKKRKNEAGLASRVTGIGIIIKNN